MEKNYKYLFILIIIIIINLLLKYSNVGKNFLMFLELKTKF